MNRKLKVVLVLSLAVNAGVLAVVGYRAVRRAIEDEQARRRYFRDRASALYFERALADYSARRESLQVRYAGVRPALGRLGLAERPDSAELEALLDRVAENGRDYQLMSADLHHSLAGGRRPEVVESLRVRSRAQLDSARQAAARQEEK